jgi:hypothetical protein
MAAKKAPMRKTMAKPATRKTAPKKKSNTADSSKLSAAGKKNLAASAKMRTDAAGRSGMGETVTSNVTYKGKGRGNMPASDTAAAAARAASAATTAARAAAKKAGKSVLIPSQSEAAYNKSLRAAQKAAGWRMDPDRPGVYVPQKQKPPSAADFRKREERAKVIAAARRKRLGK